MNKNQFDQWKQMVDENSERNLDDIIDASLDQAQKVEKRNNIFKGVGTIFTTILVFTLMVNFSNSFYVFAQEVPVLREISSLLRFSEYKKEPTVVPNKPTEPEKPADKDKPTKPQESNDSKSVNFDVGYMSGMVTSMSPIDITVNEYGPKGVDGISYYPTGPYKDGWVMMGYEVDRPAISEWNVDYIFESPTDIYKILPKMNPVDYSTGKPIYNLIPSVQKLIDDYPYVVPFGSTIWSKIVVIEEKTYFLTEVKREPNQGEPTSYTVIEYDIRTDQWKAHGVFQVQKDSAYGMHAPSVSMFEYNGKPYLSYNKRQGDSLCKMFHAVGELSEPQSLDCVVKPEEYAESFYLRQIEKGIRVYTDTVTEPTYFFPNDSFKAGEPKGKSWINHIYTDSGYQYSFSNRYTLRVVDKYLLLAHEDNSYIIINTETEKYDTFESLEQVQKWLYNVGIDSLLVDVSFNGSGSKGYNSKFAQHAWPMEISDGYYLNNAESKNESFLLFGDGKPYRIISGNKEADDWREIIIAPR